MKWPRRGAERSALGKQATAQLQIQIQRRTRDGVQQPLGVFLLRVVEEIVGRTVFNHLAVLHHDDLISHLPHHSEVVRNKQVGQIHLFLQLSEQFEHLSLHHHVEC